MHRGSNKLLVFLVTFLFVIVVLLVPKQSPELSIKTGGNIAEDIMQKVGVAPKDQKQEATLMLGGDVMLGRTVMTTSLDEKNDPRYPFLKIGTEFYDADLAFVNLEAPIIDKCPKSYEGLKFCADPSMLAGLVYAGIDVVNLANNHILNYGEQGLGQTKAFLSQRKIDYTGLGDLVVKKVGGTSFGFLGFDKVTNPDDFTQQEINMIKNADKSVDILVASVHWGNEYQEQPTQKQTQWARQLVENGVDVVVGHHPHWVQTVANIDGKPVYYSLGNLVFDQMWSEKTKEGLVVKLTFSGKEVVDEKLMKIYMKDWAQPEFVK